MRVQNMLTYLTDKCKASGTINIKKKNILYFFQFFFVFLNNVRDFQRNDYLYNLL